MAKLNIREGGERHYTNDNDAYETEISKRAKSNAELLENAIEQVEARKLDLRRNIKRSLRKAARGVGYLLIAGGLAFESANLLGSISPYYAANERMENIALGRMTQQIKNGNGLVIYIVQQQDNLTQQGNQTSSVQKYPYAFSRDAFNNLAITYGNNGDGSSMPGSYYTILNRSTEGAFGKAWSRINSDPTGIDVVGGVFLGLGTIGFVSLACGIFSQIDSESRRKYLAELALADARGELGKTLQKINNAGKAGNEERTNTLLELLSTRKDTEEVKRLALEMGFEHSFIDKAIGTFRMRRFFTLVGIDKLSDAESYGIEMGFDRQFVTDTIEGHKNSRFFELMEKGEYGNAIRYGVKNGVDEDLIDSARGLEENTNIVNEASLANRAARLLRS